MKNDRDEYDGSVTRKDSTEIRKRLSVGEDRMEQ
jgi:hypothetical protein